MSLISSRDNVAIMQPYFFPYLGYFSLIKHVDRFILFDPVQYIRHGWIDRNRILKQGEGWLYIRVPLEPHSHRTPISEIRINNSDPWKKRLMSQLATYKRIAPNYWRVVKLVSEAIEGDHESVVSLNKATLEAICAFLGMPKSFEIFTAMHLEIEEPKAADEWALNICKALGNVSEYWNPPGGKQFFDRSKYEAAGIELRFHTPSLPGYDQKRGSFEPGLSIIDALMFNSVEQVHQMLDQFDLS